MSQEIKVLLGVGTVTALILFGAVFALGGSQSPSTTSTKADPKLLIKNDSNKIGTDSAKVKIVEFGDYQCPACKAANPIVKTLMENYSSKVEFVFRNFAFIGPESNWAAEAAECSAEQGRFWDFHNYIYEHQGQENSGNFSKDNLKKVAGVLGLNKSLFDSCLDSGKYTAKIISDTNDGKKSGVNSTPTFFINGQKEVGVPNYNDFKEKIDSLLN